MPTRTARSSFSKRTRVARRGSTAGSEKRSVHSPLSLTSPTLARQAAFSSLLLNALLAVYGQMKCKNGRTYADYLSDGLLGVRISVLTLSGHELIFTPSVESVSRG